MRRRDTVFAVLALWAAPIAVGAQQPAKVWRVGVLTLRSQEDMSTSDNYRQFEAGMREMGFSIGRNLLIDYRYADGKPERLLRQARELAEARVDVIVAAGNQTISAAKQATNTIPIVIATSIDPVGSGFVESLARPGGNITGLSNLTGEIVVKQLELLRLVNPAAGLVAVLTNPTNSAHAAVLRALQAAAIRVGATIVTAEASTPDEIANAFRRMAAEKAGGAIILVDAFFILQRHQIADLAIQRKLPTVFTISSFVEAGGMVSYGQNFGENYRQAATYVAKILRGARPSDLPVEQSTRFETVVNKKTARLIGLAIPGELILRADRVIE